MIQFMKSEKVQAPVPGAGSRHRFQAPVPGTGSRHRFQVKDPGTGSKIRIQYYPVREYTMLNAFFELKLH